MPIATVLLLLGSIIGVIVLSSGRKLAKGKIFTIEKHIGYWVILDDEKKHSLSLSVLAESGFFVEDQGVKQITFTDGDAIETGSPIKLAFAV